MAVRIAARLGDSADRSLNSEGSLVTSKRHGIRLERSLKAHPHLHSAAVASWYLILRGCMKCSVSYGVRCQVSDLRSQR